jgi:hypothetical protein
MIRSVPEAAKIQEPPPHKQKPRMNENYEICLVCGNKIGFTVNTRVTWRYKYIRRTNGTKEIKYCCGYSHWVIARARDT